MKSILNSLLIASVILSLTCAPIAVYAMPEPAPATQTDKQKAAEAKKKEAEKKKKEAEKKKAAAAKEKQKAAEAKKKEVEKKKAAAAKENAKKQAERDKEAAERAKVAAQREADKAKKEAEAKAKEEKQLREYEKYIESQENPKTEVISYISLGLRAGYSALMDKIDAQDGVLWGAGTLNKSNAFQQLIGGGGAGLDLTYNLEYGHFLFETGLDFRFLNSTSKYGFNAVRQDLTYGARYNYLFDDMRETRNMMQLGLPVMFGGQFGDFYFLVGAKIHYALNCPYTQKGKYDIVVDDPTFLDPYGMGIHELNGETNQKIKFRQPDISAALEIGLDLDKWLQQQPKEVNPKDKKDKPKLKPGQRLPFGREHVHYRVSLFAEYSVLNANATAAASSVEFIPADVLVQKSNTMLAMNGNSKLNNLFVGAKFTIQFEIPGKTARPVPPPPAYAMYKVVDALSEQPLKVAFVETRGTESGKIAMKEKQIGPKGYRQRHALGNFTATANAEGYYPKTEEFTIENVGTTKDVTIAMQHRPVLHVRVVNKETGMIIPANVQIMKKGEAEPAYNLTTDTTENFVGQMLEEGPQYTIFIAQMGYDTIRMALTNIGDTMNIAMSPVKKGEVFIVRNLHFATNKTRILATSEGALNDLYAYMARNPKVRIRIIGHTDNVGKAAANQKLSEGRANAVMKELVERGIANDRIEAEGRGMKQPIDTNDTEEGRQNNRRVEIEIL